MLPRGVPSGMTLHRWTVRARTSLTLANDICSIRREVCSSEFENDTADDSMSEAELVDITDTLKRPISERLWVITSPVSSENTELHFFRVRSLVTAKGFRVFRT